MIQIHACLQTAHLHVYIAYMPIVLHWRGNGGSLDDILGLAVLKFRPLCEIYLLCFYTGINVGLYFADSSPSTLILQYCAIETGRVGRGN